MLLATLTHPHLSTPTPTHHPCSMTSQQKVAIAATSFAVGVAAGWLLQTYCRQSMKDFAEVRGGGAWAGPGRAGPGGG